MNSFEDSGSLPLVVVHMVTYNHANYVKQTIESALAQVTGFKVKLVITDDASTDGTIAICRQYQEKYPERIDFVTNQTNLGPAANSAKNLLRCFKTGAKYLAILDGDDYWCDNMKLQKQVDVLQQHEDKFSVCFSDVNYVDEAGNIIIANFIRPYYKDKRIATQCDILTYMALPTQTTLININDMHREIPKDFNRIYNGDAYFFSLLTQKKDAIYMDEVTACYRQHGGGMMTGVGEMSRIKKTIQSNFFLLGTPVLRADSKLILKHRIIDLQIQIMNILVNGGYVSLYLQEFIAYLKYCTRFLYFKDFRDQLKRFVRVAQEYIHTKTALR
jgi:glycosyltransferase involved in cell wall biosynthesis